MEDRNSNWKYVTPSLVTILIFLMATTFSTVNKIDSKVSDIDNKLFTHLTNDEIHMPRVNVVSKSEFEIYRIYNEKQDEKICEALTSMEDYLRNAKP